MKLEQTFTVAAPVEDVWAALTDVMRVAPCLPGAAITQDAGDGTFKGEFKVKIGPTTAAYDGALKIEHLDQEARVATMSAKGTDKRGNGGTTATIVSSVRADPETGDTRVDVDTDFYITGKLARFGRGGMIQDVSNRLLREFAANLQEDLAGEAPVAAGTEPAPAVADAVGPSEEAAERTSDAVLDDAAQQPSASGATAPSAMAGGTPGSAGAADPQARPRAPRAPSEPLDGGGLIVSVLTERLKGALPAFVAGLVVGVLVTRRGS